MTTGQTPPTSGRRLSKRNSGGLPLQYAHIKELPIHNLGRSRLTVLDDKDIVHELKMILSKKARSSFFKATNVVDIVSGPEMQAHFARAGVNKPSISLSTARRWLSKLGWWYGKHRGMYIDSHEHVDVVEYRRGFVHRFKEYKHCFHAWDNAGNELPRPAGFLVPGAVGRFHLVLITHYEPPFYQNDQRQVHWGCPGEGAPKPKGDGASLMVSDFLSPDWGRLRDKDRCVITAPFPFDRTHTRTAKPAFFSGLGRAGTARPGGPRNRHISGAHERICPGTFPFRQRTEPPKACRRRSLSAADGERCTPHMFSYLLFSSSFPSAPKKDWTHHDGRPRMHSGMLPTGESQSFYFSDTHPSMPGWFKGMEQILRERGLWPDVTSR